MKVPSLSFLRRAEKKPPPLQKEVAWVDLGLFGAFEKGKLNPDELIGRKGYKIYRTMLVDEQVKAVVKFKRDAITSRDWYFDFDEDVLLSDAEKDRRIGIYKRMINAYRGSFADGLNYVMMAQYQGYSLTEMIFDTFDYQGTPFIGLNRLSPKPYESFTFKVDKVGRIERAIQEMDGVEQVIDLDKFVYFIHNPEFDQHYGQSDLREAYRAWYNKDVTIKLYNRFLERMAGGLIEARPKEGQALKVGSADYNAIVSVINNLQSAGSALLPSTIELELHQATSTDQFEKAITMHDLAIAKALLVPNLLGVTHTGQTGAYAQSQTQLEAFLWTLDADASRLTDSLNEQAFQPLSEINFADGIGPKFKFKPVSEEKKMELIETWQSLVQAGAVEASDTDEEHIRELLDFPEKGNPLEVNQPVAAVPGNEPSGTRSKGRSKRVQESVSSHGGETIIGESRGVYGDIAFNRAVKRVSFEVINRRTRELESRHVSDLSNALGTMVGVFAERVKAEKLGTPAGGGYETIDGLDFDAREKAKVKKVVVAGLREAWNLGLKHAKDEINRAKGERTSVDMARIDEDAAEYLRANGFRMLGNLTDDMRAIILSVMMNGMKFSWTTDDIVKKIWEAMMKQGFMALATGVVGSGRTEEEILEALADAEITASRLRTAVRTNSFEAINEARYAFYTDPSLGGFVEAFEYAAVLDNRTTEICRHLDDRVYPADDPIWTVYNPPNHYNCRSLLVPITRIDTEIKGTDPAEEGGRFSKPPRLKPQKGFGGDE